jgi:hypothetical protein
MRSAIISTTTSPSVYGINSKEIAHGLLLSCVRLNPITIITATKSLLRCFIFNYNLVNYTK